MEAYVLEGKLLLDVADALSSISEVSKSAESTFSTLGSKLQSTGSTLSSIGTKLTLGVTTPIVGLGTAVAKTSADFEASMSNVSAISGATGSDLEALTAKAREMGAKTVFSASESADAFQYMAMAGWKTNDMLEGIDGVMNLAAASGEDLATTSDIVTDALTAFGLSASDSGHFADILASASSNANTNVSMMGETFKYAAPIAGALGFTAEDTAVAIGLMANAGIKSSQAGTSLRTIMNSLTGDIELTGAAFGETTIATTNTDGSMRSLRDIIGDLRSKFGQMTESEQASNAEAIVGKEAMSGFLAIMNATTSDMDKLTSAIDNCDGASEQMASTMTDNLSGQMKILKSELEELALQFGEALLPVIKEVVTFLQNLVEKFSGLDDGTKQVIVTIAALVAAIGPVLIIFGSVCSSIGSIITIGSTLFGGIGSIVTVLTGTLIPTIGTIVTTVGGALMTALSGVGTFITATLIPAIIAIGPEILIVIAIVGALIAIGVLLYKNWDEICQWAATLKEKVGEAWENIKTKIHDVVEAIKDKMSDMKDKIAEAWDNVKEKIGDAVEGIKDKMSEMKDKMAEAWDNVKQKTQEAVENVKQKFSELKDRVEEKVEALKEAIKGKWDEIKEKAVNTMSELKDRVIDKVTELKDRAEDKFNELKGKVIDKVNELKEKAVEKFNELAEKVVSKVTEIKDKASDKFAEMKESIGNHVTEIKEKAVSAFEEMGNKLHEKFEAVSEKVGSIFESLKEKISGIIEHVKGLFNFEWKFPDIKLPHFSLGWKTDGVAANVLEKMGLPGIPRLDVEWYKNGGIMTDPTMFGFNPATGKAMVGGEAGAEAILPIDTLRTYIQDEMNNSEMANDMNSTLKVLTTYLPRLESVLNNLNFYVNDREFARLVKGVN